MNKRVRINFKETTKEVQADVSVEYDMPAGAKENHEVLEETSQLFQAALKEATRLTTQKLHTGKSR